MWSKAKKSVRSVQESSLSALQWMLIVDRIARTKN